MKIQSIVACCNNRGIGQNGQLPWRLKKEMSYFRKLTMGNPPDGKKNAVLMGRKTWESIPKAPLHDRYNFVLSETLTEKRDGMDAVIRSWSEFTELMMSEEWSDKVHNIICIGGAKVYKSLFASPVCGRIYLTRVLADFECDTFLPEFGEDFKLLEQYPEEVRDFLPDGVQKEANGVEWVIEVYEKT